MVAADWWRHALACGWGPRVPSYEVKSSEIISIRNPLPSTQSEPSVLAKSERQAEQILSPVFTVHPSPQSAGTLTYLSPENHSRNFSRNGREKCPCFPVSHPQSLLQLIPRLQLSWKLMCCKNPTSRETHPHLRVLQRVLFSPASPGGGAVIWGAAQEVVAPFPFQGMTFSGKGQDPNGRGPRPPGAWEVRGAGDFCRGCLKLCTSQALLHGLVTRHCSPLTERWLASRTCLYGTTPFLFLLPTP